MALTKSEKETLKKLLQKQDQWLKDKKTLKTAKAKSKTKKA